MNTNFSSGSLSLDDFLHTALARAPQKFWWVIAGVIGVLLLASLIGWILAKRKPGPVVDNLNARVLAWWVMVVVLAAFFLLV